MSTILLIAQGALFGFLTGLLFPIDSNPLVFFSLIITNAVLVISYGATEND